MDRPDLEGADRAGGTDFNLNPVSSQRASGPVDQKILVLLPFSSDYAGNRNNRDGLSKMARGQREAASDSLTAQRTKAQAADRSAATAPRDLAGVENLGEYGLSAYDQFYRSRPDWTRADLTLICLAARALEVINEGEKQLKTEGMTVTSKRGAAITNPLFKLIEVQRATVMRALRDAGLRARDGAVPTSTVPKTKAGGTKAGNVTSFDGWLK